ncbi:MAG: hypothetical protein V1493_03085 [Candidatus Diapherotrites archaeon]
MPAVARAWLMTRHMASSEVKGFTRADKRRIDSQIANLDRTRRMAHENTPEALAKTRRAIYIIRAIKAAGRPPGPVRLVAALAIKAEMHPERLMPLVYACEKIPPEIIGGDPTILHQISVAVSRNRLPRLLDYIEKTGREVSVSEMAANIPDNIEGATKRRIYGYALRVLQDMGHIEEQPRKTDKKEKVWIAAGAARRPEQLSADFERVPCRLLRRLAERPAMLTELSEKSAYKKPSWGSVDGIAKEETVSAWLNAWENAGVVQRNKEGYYSLTPKTQRTWEKQQKTQFMTDDVRRITTMKHPTSGRREIGPEIREAAAKGATLSELRGMRGDLRTDAVAGILTNRALKKSIAEAEARLQGLLSHPFTIPGSQKVKYARRTLEVLQAEQQGRRGKKKPGARKREPDISKAAARGATLSELKGIRPELRVNAAVALLTESGLAKSIEEAEATVESMLSRPFTLPDSQRMKQARRTVEVLREEQQRRLEETQRKLDEKQRMRDEKKKQRLLQGPRPARAKKTRMTAAERQRREVIRRTFRTDREIGVRETVSATDAGYLRRRLRERNVLLNQPLPAMAPGSGAPAVPAREVRPQARPEETRPGSGAAGGNGIVEFASQGRFYSANGVDVQILEGAVRRQFLRDGRKPEELDRLAEEAFAEAARERNQALKNALTITGRRLREKAESIRRTRGK